MKLSVRNILRNAFAVISVLLALFVLFLLCSGTHVYAVQTDSMAPRLQPGDAVFIRAVPFEQLQPNDVISARFPESDGIFTHRIVRIDAENRQIYTRGDHNMNDDPMPTDASRIIGRLWFSVPWIGFLSLRLMNFTVIYVAVGIALALIVLRMLLSLRRKKTNGRGVDYA